MEAAPKVAESPPTFDDLLAEARKLRQFVDGLSASATMLYTRAVIDLARHSAHKIESLAEQIDTTMPTVRK